jgi:selenocysteine-specific elongation factor
MGTAGHIDHGKTALVRALTGIDCDRLEEERRRGITIELGFAHLDLPSGERLGIVDVPGHERFVKNMAAGAACIDFVLLVIAADEGVMPQTREHLDICTLLGIENGFTVLTKADVVDEELLELAREDVAAFLEGTFLENAPVLTASSVTGQGLDEVRAEIARQVAALAERPRSDLFRLPVDRVFSMRGHGTVITGTLISGRVAVGDEVMAYPSGARAKVRGLQCHGEPVQTAGPGRRTAVNLQGLKVSDVDRGDVLGVPGELFAAEAWDLELTVLASASTPLKHRTEVHFHHGARECMARLFLPGGGRAAPGETVLCQMRFDAPMAGVYGDRCVLRSFSPLRTVAGGRLVNPLGRRMRATSPLAACVRTLSAGDARAIVDAQLTLAGTDGLRLAQLRTMTPLPRAGLAELLAAMEAEGAAVRFDREADAWAHGDVVRELSARAEGYLADFHKREPLKPGLSRAALAGAWERTLSPRLAAFVVEHLAATGRIAAEQDLVRLPGHSVTLGADQEKLRARLMEIYGAGGLTPPNLDQVLEEARATPREAGPLLRMLCQSGELVQINDALYFTGAALEGLKAALRTYFETHEELGLGDFKELTGLTRKFIIPLLEYLDQDRFLLRVGDKRRLRRATAP